MMGKELAPDQPQSGTGLPPDVEFSILQIVGRAIDLRARLSGRSLARFPALEALFGAVDRLTVEIGWDDEAADEIAACCANDRNGSAGREQ